MSDRDPVQIGGEQIWRADEAAQVDVGFGTEPWRGTLKRVDVSEAVGGGVEIGVWNGKEFTPYGKGEFKFDVGQDQTDFIIEMGDGLDVPKGLWLSFKVIITIPQNITTDGGSFVISPESDPGYPFPELQTEILLLTGLFVLAGYALMKGQKNAQIRKSMIQILF